MLRGDVGTVEYTLIRTGLAREGEPIYSFRLVSCPTVGLDSLAQALAERTALNATDVKAVMEALPTEIITLLASGKAVDLGHLGRLLPTLKGSTTDLQHTLKSSEVAQFKVVFRMKQACQTKLRQLVSFSRVTHQVTPVISSLFDVNTEQYDVGAVGHLLRLRGERLNLDKTKPEEGVFLGGLRGEIYPRIGKTWLEVLIPEGVTFPASVEVRATYGSTTLRVGVASTELRAAELT